MSAPQEFSSEEYVMTFTFQHQDRMARSNMPRSAATPQHGQKADEVVKKTPVPPRSFNPRPGQS